MTTPCAGTEQQRIDASDVIVQGEIVGKPFPRIHLVKVERYFKGGGARYLLFEERGFGARDMWERRPEGRQWLFGFQDGPGGLWQGWCRYSASPDDAYIVALKPGTLPHPGINLGLRLFWLDIALIAVPVLVAGVLIRSLWRRRKAARQAS